MSEPCECGLVVGCCDGACYERAMVRLHHEASGETVEIDANAALTAIVHDRERWKLMYESCLNDAQSYCRERDALRADLDAALFALVHAKNAAEHKTLTGLHLADKVLERHGFEPPDSVLKDASAPAAVGAARGRGAEKARATTSLDQ